MALLIRKIIIYYLSLHFIWINATGFKYSTRNDTGRDRATNRVERDTSKWLLIRIRDGNKLIELNLHPTNQRLANEFVPVWYASKGPTGNVIYTKDIRTMGALGEFTLYQDREKNAAIVYFHMENILRGVIGNRYYIKNLPIIALHTVLNVGGPYVKKRKSDECPFKTSQHSNKWGIPNTFESNPNDSRNNAPAIVYPEIMIIIANDLLNDLEGQSRDNNRAQSSYLKTLAYILTYFNAVDMLYSKFSEPSIELNIAKIIIETEPGILKFLSNNKKTSFSIWGNTIRYNAVPVLNDLETSMTASQLELFDCDTFDMTLLMTGQKLYDDNIKLDGLASRNIEPYLAQVLLGTCQSYALRAIIRDSNSFYKSFPIAAHEIAHLFDIKHDPAIEDIKFSCGCPFNVMGEQEDCCPDCLQWSEKSIQSFKRYFREPKSCVMINYPRSLAEDHPKRLVTRNQLCNCYYHAYATPNSETIGFDCSLDLQCVHGNGDVRPEPIPMEGTACGHGKVCWKKQCVKAVPYVDALDNMPDTLMCA